MNNIEKTAAYHVERAQRLQRRNERRANALTACGIIAAVAIIAVLLAGAGRADLEYTEETVTVRSGDTLWGIADAYCPENMDKREFVRMIEEDNECDSDIMAGQILTVRVYEK